MALSIISLASLFFIGRALSWVFIKTKIPDLLILMIIGYILGPMTGFLSAESFGKSGTIISTIALVVILYEGGLSLKASQLKDSFFISFLLSVLTFFSIGLLTTLFVTLFGGQPIHVGILCGLGIGSTSSAIVIPMVKNLSIGEKTKTILALESAFTDVFAIVFFLVAVASILKGFVSANEILMGIGPGTLVSALLGLLSGLIWACLKKWFPPIFNMAFAGEAWALLSYGLIEVTGYNGAIGALALGFTLANLSLLPQTATKLLSFEPVSTQDLSLLNELIFLLRTFFFIYLGVLIRFTNIPIVLLALVISISMFVTRYLIVKILMKKSENKLDAMITTAMGPRGLACAVVATIPLQNGIEGGEFIQNLVFAVIPISILFTAMAVACFERQSLRTKFEKFW